MVSGMDQNGKGLEVKDTKKVIIRIWTRESEEPLEYPKMVTTFKCSRFAVWKWESDLNSQDPCDLVSHQNLVFILQTFESLLYSSSARF